MDVVIEMFDMTK